MSIDYSQLAQPKGKTRKQLRARAKRADTKALKDFVEAVWAREHAKIEFDDAPTFARCQDCGAWINRSTVSMGGHVHHVVSRRHKASRTDPANGRLLCRACHNRAHQREF